MIRYIVPFTVLSQWWERYDVAGSDELDMPYPSYLTMLRRLLEPVQVDAAWYLAANPGVARAVAGGEFASAGHHYLSHGYFEDRPPFAPDRADRRPPPPFSAIRADTPARAARGGLRARLSRARLLGIVARMLQAVPVDESWYRAAYPGVAAAIAAGGFASAAAHYVQHGYTEARFPFAMPVDADWYLRRYPDVAAMIAAGGVASAGEHFWRDGYREGRFPAGTPLSAGDEAAAPARVPAAG
jgi:hypothetical protein